MSKCWVCGTDKEIIHNLAKENAELRDSLSESKALGLTLKSNVDIIEKVVLALTSDRDNLKADKERLLAENEVLNGKIRTQEAEKALLAKTISELRTRVSSLQAPSWVHEDWAKDVDFEKMGIKAG